MDVAGLMPNKILETNIFAKASGNVQESCGVWSKHAPFHFLVESLKLAVIVAHGKDAIAHLTGLSTDAIKIEATHLSRGWSRAKAVDLVKQIRLCL